MDWLSIICDLIIPVLGLVLTVLVVPWLRETRAWKYVQIAVRAAEQIFGGGTGPEKYEYVRKLLVAKIHLSDAEAQRLIEAAVRELEQVGEQIIEPEHTDAIGFSLVADTEDGETDE